MTPVSQQTRRTPPAAVTFSCIPVSAPGDITAWTGKQEATAGDSSATWCFICHLTPMEGQHPSCLYTKTCAAAFCFSLRCTIQLPGIPAQSALTGDDSRPPAKTAAQTHHFKGKSTLFVLNTWTHVWHGHIWSLHLTQPPPPRTPRPSIQQHPALTFKDVCTEAVKDEDQVLLDNHILLFSFTISRRHSTRVCLCLFSLSLFSSGWTYPGKRHSFGLTGVTLMNSAFSWEVPVYFRRSGGSDYSSLAGRQRCSSAKCSSCLPLLPFSLTRCREQESRPRFLTNEDASPMENT